MNNVKDFLINDKNFVSSTFKNRFNLLRRTLIKIKGGAEYLKNDSKVIKYKEPRNNEKKNDKNF